MERNCIQLFSDVNQAMGDYLLAAQEGTLDHTQQPHSRYTQQTHLFLLNKVTGHGAGVMPYLRGATAIPSCPIFIHPWMTG